MRTAIVITTLTVIAVTLGVYLTVATRRNQLVWDHFDVVKHGLLYRSGQLNPSQLEQAVKRYNIRTVISFQYPGIGVDYERSLAKSFGIDFVNLPMPGDGFGQEHQFREVIKAVDDPNRRPVLVHCARGTCRTGSAVALYRFERDGWTIGDVSAEMKRQSYRDGWIPGYIYNMVSQRPSLERIQPVIVHDSNLPKPSPPTDDSTGLTLNKEAAHVD